MKQKIFLVGILLISIIHIFTLRSYAADNDEELMNSQKETFGINSFIENSKKYSGEFFDGIDINSMLNMAINGKIDNNTLYKKIVGLLGREVRNGIKSLVSILVIIVIHSILKSISENLKNDGVSKMIYYVQYIAIVTVIMTNFSDGKRNSSEFSRIYEFFDTNINIFNDVYGKYYNK